MNNPYLSIVIAGRNDNYGGDFRQRLQNCVNWTFLQLTKEKISSEIIFVNYNPLPEPAIEKFISWPSSNELVTVKILTVSSETHNEFVKYQGVKNVPVLEYVAKNTGIRRAKGEFVLSMNPDILMDERLFQNFKNFREDCYYRCNRFDYSDDLEINAETVLFHKLKNRITQIWFKGNYVKVDGINIFSYYFHWFMKTINNFWKGNTEKIQFVLNPFRINVYTHNVEFWYHCNAAGDFMLTARKNWHRLNGYRENAYISLHTDSLFVIQAATAGISEKTFRYPVFHKQHERRYDALKENDEQRKIYLDYQHIAKNMVKRKKTEIFNNDDWGLKNAPIMETLL